MARGTVVVAGPARSGKTRRLLDAYARVLADGPPGAALWLAPTHRAAAAVREQIVAGGLAGALYPHCLTFDQFARRVLEASPLAIRPIASHVRRQILRELVAESLAAGRLSHFEPIARTTGFLDLLVGFIEELKRLEIWPEEFERATAGSASPKDHELWHLYHEYQRLLTEHDLYDSQGRFWSARARLRDGQTRPFDVVRHMFVDGFTDFTRTEHEILEVLAGRVESLTVSLTLEIDSPREELFAKSAATLGELARRHPKMSVERLAIRPSGWPAMDHVERNLFAAPHEIPPAPQPQGIEILAAAGATNEIELVARRIKLLLTRGETQTGAAVRPGDVLVVFRSLNDVADLVREVFAEYGIPVAIGSRPQLERAPIARALVAALRLELDDWPFDQLVALLTHNYFRPSWPEWHEGRAAAAVDYLVRRAQIPSGRAALVAHLGRLATAAVQAEQTPDKPLPLAMRRATMARPLLRRLSASFEVLPHRATLAEWSDAIGQLATDLGLLKAAASKPSSAAHAGCELAAADELAWRQLMAAIGESARLSVWLGRPAAELTRREFLDLLCDLLRSVPLPEVRDEPGRVRVLGAEAARHLSSPYVFVAGLAERAFPAPQRDDCLVGRAETRRLVEAGLPLVSPADRRGLEMLLFYEIATRATRRLVLSYPALDESAQPLSPSPYLGEIQRLFAAKLKPAGPPELSSVHATDEVCSPRELRVRAVAEALEGRPSLLARYSRQTSAGAVGDPLLAALEMSSSRRSGESFGPFEGVLTSERALAQLAKRFGAEHCWSPSQLEQYASCPHQFFLERVLGLEPIEDTALAINYAARGSMLHALLAALHRGMNARLGRLVSPAELPVDHVADELTRLLVEMVEASQKDRPLTDGMLEIDARRLATWLTDYWRQHGQYDVTSSAWDEPLRPAHFEVSFGPRAGGQLEPGPRELEDPLSTSEPFVLACGEEAVRFSGRIDRIDLGRIAGQAVFGIIDYKSGRSESARAKAILDGLALQLPLYALAAEWLLAEKQALGVSVGYWHVVGKGCKERLVLRESAADSLEVSPQWQSLARDLPRRIASLVRGIRQGQFPMMSADEKCTSRCAFHTVCRVNQVRALGKQWQPPREEEA